MSKNSLRSASFLSARFAVVSSIFRSSRSYDVTVVSRTNIFTLLASFARRWGYWSRELEKDTNSTITKKTTSPLTSVFAYEIVEFTRTYQEFNARPSHWLPKLSAMKSMGREDLPAAIYRFGGTEHVCRELGFVEFEEWFYFESFLRNLCIPLQTYINNYCDDSEMPQLKKIRRDGFHDLARSIIKFGGRKLIGERLGLIESCDWGPFSLSFAIDLLEYTFANQRKKGINAGRRISILKTSDLMKTKKGRILYELIDRFGGFEGVARRLQLHFDFDNNLW